MSVFDLPQLGWDRGFAALFDDLNRPDLTPGRVLAEHAGQVEVATAAGATRATAPPPDVDLDSRPAVGDWVALRPTPDHIVPAAVAAVLPRRTRFVRKTVFNHSHGQLVAANIDTVFVATSLNRDFNPRRLERYLAVVAAGGARAVVLLTKADLLDPAALVAAQARVPAEHVVALSALKGWGLDGLAPWLGPGQTVAIVGSSGVGKSTLVNALLGRQVQDTGEIREHDARGRHTTTGRRLLPLPGGGALVDTPGMRELGLFEADLDSTFEDVVALAERCRWRDCAHDQEPGCAVQQAVEEGALTAGRLASFQKLQRELDFERRRQDVAARRRSARQQGRMIRSHMKHRRRRWDE